MPWASSASRMLAPAGCWGPRWPAARAGVAARAHSEGHCGCCGRGPRPRRSVGFRPGRCTANSCGSGRWAWCRCSAPRPARPAGRQPGRRWRRWRRPPAAAGCRQRAPRPPAGRPGQRPHRRHHAGGGAGQRRQHMRDDGAMAAHSTSRSAAGRPCNRLATGTGGRSASSGRPTCQRASQASAAAWPAGWASTPTSITTGRGPARAAAPGRWRPARRRSRAAARQNL